MRMLLKGLPARPLVFLALAFLIGVLASWLLGLLLLHVLEPAGLHAVDRSAVTALVHERSGWLTRLMKALSFAASTPVVTATIAVVAGVSYARSKTLRVAIFMVATIIGAVALDNVVKFLVKRHRPDLHPLVHAFGSSFPSGHSVAAAALFGTLAYLATRGRSRSLRIFVWIVAATGACGVAFSRVYLGAHWPTDVVVGLLLGAYWTLASVLSSRASEEARAAANSASSNHWTR
jgi:undecaprenyl-diphosphatase